MNTLSRASIIAGILVLALAGPASASTTVEWEGNGSESLPCETGGHWVLSPAKGITEATLTVDGVTYVMEHHGKGAWSADSTGSVDGDTEASATYEGDNDKAFLKLSHCTDTPPTSTPPPTTTTPPPTTTTPPATTTPPETTPPNTRSPVKPTQHNRPRPSPTAFTGSDVTLPAIALGVLLAAGLGATLYARKRSG